MTDEGKTLVVLTWAIILCIIVKLYDHWQKRQ